MFVCPAGDLTVLVTVVQYLTRVLWPARDLPVLVSVFGVSDQCVLSCRRSPCFGDCGSESGWCVFDLQEISLFR